MASNIYALITLLNFVLVCKSEGPTIAIPPFGFDGVPARTNASPRQGSTLFAKSLELQTKLVNTGVIHPLLSATTSPTWNSG